MTKPDETNPDNPFKKIAACSDEEMDRLLQVIEADAETQEAMQKDLERQDLVDYRITDIRIHMNGIATISGIGAILAGLLNSDPRIKLGFLGTTFASKGVSIIAKYLEKLPIAYFSSAQTKENLEACKAHQKLTQENLDAEVREHSEGVSLSFISSTIEKYMAKHPDQTPRQKRSALLLLVRAIAQSCVKHGIPLHPLQTEFADTAEYAATLIVESGSPEDVEKALKLAEKIHKPTADSIRSSVETLKQREAAAYDEAAFKACKAACNTVRLLGTLTGNTALTTMGDVTSHTLDMGKELQHLTSHADAMLTPEKWLSAINVTNALLSCMTEIMQKQKSFETVCIQKLDKLRDLVVAVSEKMQDAIRTSTAELKEEIETAYQNLTEQMSAFEQRAEVVQYRQHAQTLAIQHRTQALVHDIRALVQAQGARFGENLEELTSRIDAHVRAGDQSFLAKINVPTAQEEYDRLMTAIRQCAAHTEAMPVTDETQQQFLQDTEADPKAWAIRLMRFFIRKDEGYRGELEERLLPESANFDGTHLGNPAAAALHQLDEDVPPRNPSALTTNTAQPQTWLTLATYLQVYLLMLPPGVRQQLVLFEQSILNPAKNYRTTVAFVEEKAPEAYQRNIATYRAQVRILCQCFTKAVSALLSQKVAAELKKLTKKLKLAASNFDPQEIATKVNSAVPSDTKNHTSGEKQVAGTVGGGAVVTTILCFLFGGPVGLAAAPAAIGAAAKVVENNLDIRTRKRYSNLLQQPGDGKPAPLFQHHQDRLKQLWKTDIPPQINCDHLIRAVTSDSPDFSGIFSQEFYKNFVPLRVMFLRLSTNKIITPEKKEIALHPVELPESVSKKLWELMLGNNDCLYLVVMSLLGLASLIVEADHDPALALFSLKLIVTETDTQKTEKISLGQFSLNSLPSGSCTKSSSPSKSWEEVLSELRAEAIKQPAGKTTLTAINTVSALLRLYGSLNPKTTQAAQAGNTNKLSLRFSSDANTRDQWDTKIENTIVRLQAAAIGYMQADLDASTDDLTLERAKAEDFHRQYKSVIATLELMRLETSGISTLVGQRAHQWQAKTAVEGLLEWYKEELAPYNTNDLGLPDAPCVFGDAQGPTLTSAVERKVEELDELFRNIQSETPVPPTREPNGTGGNEQEGEEAAAGVNSPLVARSIPTADLQQMTAEQRAELRADLAAKREALDSLLSRLDATDHVGARVASLGPADEPGTGAPSRYRLVGAPKPPGSATGDPRVEIESDEEARATM